MRLLEIISITTGWGSFILQSPVLLWAPSWGTLRSYITYPPVMIKNAFFLNATLIHSMSPSSYSPYTHNFCNPCHEGRFPSTWNTNLPDLRYLLQVTVLDFESTIQIHFHEQVNHHCLQIYDLIEYYNWCLRNALFTFTLHKSWLLQMLQNLHRTTCLLIHPQLHHSSN